MKKAICVAVTGVILISSVFIGAAFGTQDNRAQAAQAVSVPNKYIIKSEKCRLVVYKSGNDAPFLTTETFSDNLPKSDVDRLKKGVEVSGERNLRKMLEDYCS